MGDNDVTVSVEDPDQLFDTQTFIVTVADTVRASCVSDVDLNFADGTTTWTFLVGATAPSTWSTSVNILGNDIPLWSIGLPAVDPPISLSFSFAIPPIGVIEVASTVTVDGVECSDSDTVDTGVPSP